MRCSTFFLLIFFTCSNILILSKPRVTVIIVVDQLAYSYLPKLAPFLKHGIKFFMQEGIVYHNAYFPHSMPSTGPGHTSLTTGITADYHGIIANNWCDAHGKKIACDDDNATTAAVINPTGGFYDRGKGPCNIMVDSISDQFALSSQPDAPCVSFAVSLKSRSAICSANKMGKALWFDSKTGFFTSSKAYFDQLPEWLVSFNNQQTVNKLTKISWPLFYPKNSRAYNFKYIDNYRYSTRPPMAGKTMIFNANTQHPLDWYEHTPAANQLLFDLALHCIKTNIEIPNQHMLIWICLSSLDMIGHDFGPYSREAIDMIYHLDYQIGQFMNALGTYIDPSDILFVLSADHGITPIPELLKQQGYNAHRINTKKIIPQINFALEKQFGIHNLITACTSSQIYLNPILYNTLDANTQKQSSKIIRNILSAQPGIKHIWTAQELKTSCFGPDQIESFYKKQFYSGRSGQFIIQPFPYCLLDDYNKGTGHRTPYEPDTHVPLILYQKNSFERKIITDKVWIPQLANSLAHILHIPKPSASTYDMLPGLIKSNPAIS